MTPEAAVVRALLGELDAVMAMGFAGKRSGHTFCCPYGLWMTSLRIPDGEPCSKRCVAAKQAIRAARRWLADHEAPHQPSATCVDTCENPYVCRDEHDKYLADPPQADDAEQMTMEAM